MTLDIHLLYQYFHFKYRVVYFALFVENKMGRFVF